MIISVNSKIRITPFKLVVASDRAIKILAKLGPQESERLKRFFYSAANQTLSKNEAKKFRSLLSRRGLVFRPFHGRIAILSPFDFSSPKLAGANDTGEPQKSHYEVEVKVRAKPENVFSSGLEIIEAKHAGRFGLVNFLERDQEGKVFKKLWTVTRGTTAFGAHGKRRLIYGLENIKKLYTVVVQESLNGQQIKKMYGWTKDENWGKLESAEIIYILARETSSGWKILKRPFTNVSLNKQQETQRETARMVEFLFQDQGEKVYQRDFNVIRTKTHNGKMSGRISYTHKRKQYSIYGLNNYERVRMLVSERTSPRTGQREKIARLYGYENGHFSQESLGKYCLAYKEGGKWILSYPPQPISSTNQVRINKERSQKLKNFLLNDQSEGSEITIPKWKVYSSGSIRITFDRKPYAISGLKKYAGKKIFGVIRQEGSKKIAYLWENKASFQHAEPPLKPEGDLLALKKEDKWEMIEVRKQKLVDKRDENSRYINYLFSDNPIKRYFSHWSIHRRKNRRYQVIYKHIRGRVVSFYSPVQAIAGLKRVLGVTRQIEGIFKLVEFYRDMQAFQEKQPPIRVAFLACKNNGIWKKFIADITADTPFPVSALSDRALITLIQSRFLKRNYPDFFEQLIAAIEAHLRRRYPSEVVTSYVSEGRLIEISSTSGKL